VAKCLKKGDLLAVDERLEWREWQAQTDRRAKP
jgi:single-stranded DNA-binding protein